MRSVLDPYDRNAKIISISELDQLNQTMEFCATECENLCLNDSLCFHFTLNSNFTCILKEFSNSNKISCKQDDICMSMVT